MTDTLTRRSFLATTSAGAAAACTGCALFQRRDEDIELESADVIAFSLDEQPRLREPNGFVRAEVDARDARVIIINRPDVGIIALDMSCPHMGCDVDWLPDTGELECSCHGSRFAANGDVLEGPAEEALDAYVVTRDGDAISVDLTQRVPRS